MEVITNLQKCPWCGAENAGAMGKLVQEEVSKHSISSKSMPVGATRIDVHIVIDPMRPPIAGGRVPALRKFSDTCTECGRDFTFRIEKGHAMLPVRQGEAPVFA